MKDLYTAQVSITSGRDGKAASSDGRLDVALALPTALGGSGDGANPEQLFAAGYAACFASSLKAAAASRKTAIGAVRIDAEAVLSVREDGSYLVSRVALAVNAESLGADAAQLVEEAKRICAYSNATRGNVATTVTLA
jgi:Ohr subfamily peroxiredoxin